MQIKDNPSLKWSEKTKGDPNKRNRNKYCRFHIDYGHDTNKYFNLKEHIENLIRQGKLRNFLGQDHKDEKLKGKVEESSCPILGEIRVIIGGTSIGQSSKSRKTNLKVVQNVQLSRKSPRTRATDKQAITFTDEDAERVLHPMTTPSSSLCLLLTIQPEGCLWTMEVRQTSCIILLFSK